MRKILLLLLLCAFNAYSQTDLKAKAPTLQVGLDNLTFTKGTLDAKLIMEIIAEKQKELKIKAIQNVFLAKVEPAGGAIYSFTNNVVKELLLESDQSLRTKKIMENTVNLVFAIAFLEYYLNNLDTESINDFNHLCKVYKVTLDAKDMGKVSLSNFLKKREDKNNTKEGIADKDSYRVELLALLIDMAAETIRQDVKLKELGLMQISYSDTYEYLNRYKNPKIYAPEDAEYDILSENLSRDMKERLGEITNYIGLVNYVVEHFSFRNDKLAVFNKRGLNEKTGNKARPFEYTDENTTANSYSLSKSFSDLKDITHKLLEERINVHANDTLGKTEINNLTQMYYYFDRASKQVIDMDNDKEIMADILYTFYGEFMPLIKKQGYTSLEYINLLEEIDLASARIASVLLDKDDVFKLKDGKIDDFMLLAAKLYEFDKASTISDYIKLIEGIGYIFPSNNITNALSTVVSFVKDYSVTDKDKNGKEVLEFNIESFIVRLQRVKPYQHKAIEFNFTVGLNNAYFQHNVPLKDNTVANLSFVSEKIGVKWKLWDWAFYYTRNPGETYAYGDNVYVKKTPPHEPLISNIHLLAYGSGILYNVVNAKTDKEFDFPMAGVGAGITFSNALDLNISLGVPLMSQKSFQDLFYYKYINIGFDIQFLEYFDRLSEKQQAKKTQKLLAEAAEKN
ncbi:hypothetical protein AM493_17810 [Flavobacterium akiainvivens]|uniref:Uncharacterized protein n=1 Tax=Flavobacterium akiainvivens TaxID=1202724 RepID=A0A0M8MBI8_9FLAO|nr:hypothetical protein [Flavobacterium akiainvivens]KOS07693.1 hypothetical protein AM493_17810 [Flavobacterium akiainvivens]SFQ24368.1 hypothetical protein SAMN05444144_102143 [Flavobacterium akiainvivens]